MAWTFDPTTRLYTDDDTGRTLSDDEIEDLIDELVDDTVSNVTDILSDMLADERLTVSEWLDAMSRAIMDIFVMMAILAAGGLSLMETDFWDIVIGGIDDQYTFLENFARQLANGELSTGDIRRRSRMYINSSRWIFWAVLGIIMLRRGRRQERWISKGDKDVCDPCTSAEGLNWQPINTFAQPGSGIVLNSPQTMCRGLTSCRCTKEFR